MLCKLAKLNGTWKYLILSDQEELEIKRTHRAMTKAVMQQCILDGIEIVSRIGIEEKQFVPMLTREVVPALFERRCEHVTSALLKALDNSAVAAIKKLKETKAQ